MSYLNNVYYSRINHMGESIGERIRSGGIRSFEKWMAESPHTVQNLSVERGIYFSGLILTSKDKEYEKIMFLNVSNDIPIMVGDIMTWPLENGTLEKWLLIQEEKKVNGTYRTFWIIRCNYLIKWIDGLGHLQKSWAYVVSSVDSKIKGNFRTWNNLITPQPNKYMEIVLPRYNIGRSTNFIVEDESWLLVEYDYTSVPGVIYLSLTENKVNMIYDDLENDIADTDKMANYTLAVPVEHEIFHVGDTIIPTCTLLKDGQIASGLTLTYTSTDHQKIKMQNGVLTAVAPGDVPLIVSTVEFPHIQQQCTVSVVDQNNGAVAETAYIEGPDWIKLARTAQYKLVTTGGELINNVQFSLLSADQLASGQQIDNDYIVTVNAKNKLGSFKVVASYNNHEYEKDVIIKPLW